VNNGDGEWASRVQRSCSGERLLFWEPSASIVTPLNRRVQRLNISRARFSVLESHREDVANEHPRPSGAWTGHPRE
jgi:hypothetical protein